jgi:hypothetical protein
MRIRRPSAAFTLFVGAVLVLGSCGSSSRISSEAGAQLQLRVAAIRDAAARGDRDAAATQLTELRVVVVRFRADDKVDDTAATRILQAAEAVQAELARLEPLSTTTASSTTTTTKAERPGKGKGGGQGGKHDEGD